MARKREPKWLKAVRAGGTVGETVPLGRALARAGAVQGGKITTFLHSKRIMLGDALATDAMAPVRPGDVVTVDGRPVSLDARTRVLAFHKPKGVVTAGTDPEEQGTVFERLAAALPSNLANYGWHAVGRLDRDTTGLLLFTNDEGFVAHATSPTTHLKKRYVALVDGSPDEAKLEPLRKGLAIGEETLRPAEAAVRGRGVVELTLTEGKHHQVRRMLDAVGLPVRGLHREAVGGLTLDVAEDAVRALDDDEIRRHLGYEPRKLWPPESPG